MLLSLYGPNSPLGVDVANTRAAVFLALAFVTLPFIVRTVQPVLEELDADVEEAAASLGAEPAHHVPADHPAEPGAGDRRRRGAVLRPRHQRVRLAGAALAATCRTAPRSSRCACSTYIENGNPASAAAVATLMLVVALVVIVALDVIQRRVARRG